MTQPLAPWTTDTTAPRAPHFIVTIYGDVVSPRGGSVWMGSLIEACAVHGISESLVRTAVSRLVGSGRLEGVRLGRKSYYRLSQAAQREFADASRILFDPPPRPEGWRIALREPGTEGGLDPRFPWVRIGTGAALAPERPGLSLPGAVLLTGAHVDGDMLALASAQWALDEVAAAYHVMLARFSALPDPNGIGGADALALRLRLVDDYRRAALADPRLPATALPADWPAREARALFLRLYLALSPAADRHVARLFQDRDGPLAEASEATVHRLQRLVAETPD